MTFDEYIANPMGKSNAVMSAGAREAQRRIYTTKFNNVLLRENGKIDYYLYKGKEGTYYAHILVPSEVVNKFYYDVVIKFTGDDNLAASGAKLNKYQVQFYSNDPAFVYTYAYTFNKRGLFLTELSSRMSRKALRQPESEKNPESMVGYVKSLYFAYLFMQNRGLFAKARYITAEDLNLKTLVSRVMPADEKVALRQEEGEKISKRKKVRVTQDTANKIKRIGAKNVDMSNLEVATSKNVKVVKNAAKNSTIGRTKTSKKV